MQTNTLAEILQCWAIIGATILLAMMAGLVSSSMAARTPAATAMAYGILFFISFATFFPWLARDRVTGTLADLLYGLNPFVSSIQVLTAGFFQELPELWKVHLGLTFGLSLIFFLFAYMRVRRMLLPEK
jgi:hypothetical protein